MPPIENHPDARDTDPKTAAALMSAAADKKWLARAAVVDLAQLGLEHEVKGCCSTYRGIVRVGAPRAHDTPAAVSLPARCLLRSEASPPDSNAS
jgi:hypothetical protein